MQKLIAREYLHAGKRYVEVLVRFSAAGELRPLSLVHEGRVWEIERIYSIKQRASQRAGGCGLCYECRIGERRHRLFLEGSRWFIEAPGAAEA